MMHWTMKAFTTKMKKKKKKKKKKNKEEEEEKKTYTQQKTTLKRIARRTKHMKTDLLCTRHCKS